MISDWGLWDERLRAVVFLLGVELAAIAVPAVLARPAHFGELGLATSLTALSFAFTFVTVKWERVRRVLTIGFEHGLTVNMQATWCFVAAVLLPSELAVVVVCLIEIGAFPMRKMLGIATPYRFIYSTANLMLNTCAAGTCMLLPLPLPMRLALAAFAYIVTNVGGVGCAMIAVGDYRALRVLADRRSHMLLIATVLIALGEVLLLDLGLSILIWLSLPAAIGLQHLSLRAALREEPEIDQRPMVEEAWQLVAREVVAASDAAAIMRIDTGDPVAVTLVARVQAGCDAIGQNGPNGLAILLTDCPGPNADAIAARMRSALQGNKIEGHVAVAAKPRDGQTLADLLAVSEAELIAMEAASQTEEARPGDL